MIKNCQHKNKNLFKKTKNANHLKIITRENDKLVGELENRTS